MDTTPTTPTAADVFGAATGHRPRTTSEHRVAKFFGLEGTRWLRHANPWSVWTRFAVLPLLALAVWSREWIGWWCLVPVAATVGFLMVNPLLFRPPRSTRNWASRGVFGERVYAERVTVGIPDQYRSRVLAVTNLISAGGIGLLAYGLVVLDPVAAVAGLVLAETAKAWYIDRMVLLFEDMRTREPEYAGWDY